MRSRCASWRPRSPTSAAGAPAGAADLEQQHWEGTCDVRVPVPRAVAVHQQRGLAESEELRGAVTSHRSLIEVLLDDSGASTATVSHPPPCFRTAYPG
jgi:hypothetical protein